MQSNLKKCRWIEFCSTVDPQIGGIETKKLHMVLYCYWTVSFRTITLNHTNTN